MSRMKSLLKTATLAALVAGGAVAATSAPASADVVCNRFGECWRTHTHYDAYPARIGVTFYGDDWYRAHRYDRHYHWRAGWHDGRGYYYHGHWRRW